jgi:3-dehydroquinate synthase
MARNIFLVGFSGTGKTRVARHVARLLTWSAVDVDSEIVRRAGKPIHRIFAEDGEVVFRKLEATVLKEVSGKECQVVATGGGAFVSAANRRLLLGSGLVVCLEAQAETILRRLCECQDESDGTSVRPLLEDKEPLVRIRSLKRRRQQYYAQAHWTVHTDLLSEGEVAQEVVKAWHMMAHRVSGGRDPELAAVVTHSSGGYPVYVGWGLIVQMGKRLLDIGLKGPAYLVSDEGLYPKHVRYVQQVLEQSGIATHVYIVPRGEATKNLDMVRNILDWLIEHRVERRHVVIALGGGMVGDLAGYVAATCLRGLNLVQVPTSLLAMVDASIGGKVAVNLPQGRNLVGAFYQPRMVLADVSMLSTLGERECREGWTEAIKHGLILDRDLFETFEEHADKISALEPDVTTTVIRRSMAIKAQVVSEDEREADRRILLNYGHTIGHALETVAGYGRYYHGEAVSVGMMGAAMIGCRLGMTGDDIVRRQQDVLVRFGLPVSCPGADIEALWDAMGRDKKMAGGTIRWVLLGGLGRAVVRRDVPTDIVTDVLRELAET